MDALVGGTCKIGYSVLCSGKTERRRKGAAPFGSQPRIGYVRLVIVIVTMTVVVIVVINVMDVDSNAAAHAAADPLSDRCNVTARTHDGSRRDLWDVDEIPLRVGGHRMRVG